MTAPRTAGLQVHRRPSPGALCSVASTSCPLPCSPFWHCLSHAAEAPSVPNSLAQCPLRQEDSPGGSAPPTPTDEPLSLRLRGAASTAPRCVQAQVGAERGTHLIQGLHPCAARFQTLSSTEGIVLSNL